MTNVRNLQIATMGVILIAATATAIPASAKSRGMGSSQSMNQVSRVPSGGVVVRDHRPAPIIRDHRTPAPAPIVRDHRDTAAQKVIRPGRNYDKVEGREQVIVNGKRVPRRV